MDGLVYEGDKPFERELQLVTWLTVPAHVLYRRDGAIGAIYGSHRANEKAENMI